MAVGDLHVVATAKDENVDIKKEYEIPYPVEYVFSAWISTESTVPPVTSIEIDPRVGGVFRLRVGSGEDATQMDGRIQKIERNRSIQYTWHWGGPGEPSTVAVHFAPSIGGTKISVVHSGLNSPETVAGHELGWDSYLTGLQSLLAKADSR